MADLEDELLALAGDDSDEESSHEQQQTQSAAVELESGEESEDDQQWQQSASQAPKGKLRKDDDAGSQHSADMSESAGSMPDDEAEHSQYPIEGKFKSETDRETIMALPEVEREQILAERAEELAKAEENRKLRALFRSYGGNKKRKASESDLRDARQTSRVKTQKDKSLDELRRKREERGAVRAGLANKKRRSFSSEPDADGESEPEWDDRRREKTPEERAVELKDYEHIKIGYQNFAKVCFYPDFAGTMVGCYVRLSVGQDPRHKRYRMAKIEEIVERHPYAMDSVSGSGRKFITTQHIVASIGKSKREWPFINCSQGAFTQPEMDEYLDSIRGAGLLPPKLSHLLAKNRDLHAMIGRTFTNAELSSKVNMSAALQDRYRQHKKGQLLKQRDQLLANAGETEDSTSVRRLDQQIASVMTDRLNLRYGTSMPNQESSAASPRKAAGAGPGAADSPKQLTQQQRLAQLNRERAKNDQQRIRNALLQDQRLASRRKQAVPDRAATPANGDRGSRVGTPAATAAGTAAAKDDNAYKKDVKMVDGKPQHNFFSADDDWELPRPHWKFNYVEYSNNYLGARSMHHLSYDAEGRAISAFKREITWDEVVARMDLDLGIEEEY